MTENKDFEDVLKNLAGTQEDDTKDNKEASTEAKEKIVYDPKESWQKESLLRVIEEYFRNKQGSDWNDQKRGIIKDILDDEHWFYIILIIVGTGCRVQTMIDPSTGDLWESDSDFAKAGKLNDQVINLLIDFAITNVIGETGRDKVFEKLQTKYPFQGHLSKHGMFTSKKLLEPNSVDEVENIQKELEECALFIKDESLSHHIAGFLCKIALVDGHIDKTEKLLISNSIKTVYLGINKEIEPDIEKISEAYQAEMEKSAETQETVVKEEIQAENKAEKENSERVGIEMAYLLGFGYYQAGEKSNTMISYPRLVLTSLYFIFIIANEIFISGFLVGLIGLIAYAYYKTSFQRYK